VPRQHEVTRLEGFSDAVFGFALTLLVVKLEVPDNPVELHALFRGSVPFALTFAMVCYIWWEHNKFFRHYGLQDAWTAFLNCVLLFVVLFYVYPLKYLTTALLGPVFNVAHPQFGEAQFVMQLYSGGVALIFGTLALLYRHAWQQRRALQLSASEEVQLRFGQRAQLISMSLGIVSIALAQSVPDQFMWLPGVIYGLMGPLHGWNGYLAGLAQSRVDKASATTA
jgi:uncharacterized membrane protein